jgi:hypothetical protein
MSTLAEPIPITGAAQAADRRRRIIAIAMFGGTAEYVALWFKSADGRNGSPGT